MNSKVKFTRLFDIFVAVTLIILLFNSPAPAQPAQEEKTKEPLHSSPNDTSKIRTLSAEQTKNLDEYIRGSFSGIGVGIDIHPNGIYIKNVFSGGPADNAGLKSGEVITAVNGDSTVGMPLERAVSLLKGPKNTTVNLKVLSSNGTLRDVSVVRGTVIASGVESRILEPNIGLLVISRFNKETTAAVRKAINYFQEQNIRGLVLDLRNNKGGFFPAVREITSMFTGPDQIIWYVQHTSQTERTPEKGTVQKMVRWPVVVLINSETTCGGELLASAVKSTGGKLLGQKTFGEGTIYKLEEQPNGSSKKIPTGYFYTADGQAIDKQGVSPDKELDPKLSSEEVLKQAVIELTAELQNRK
jgi:carboxyl-terminal processing protease